VFTGLVDDVGHIEEVRGTEAGREFRVRCRYDDLADGESIALDGVCLTVREKGAGWFTAAAVVTTLGRTHLGDWEAGRRVNLERALRFGDRLGGHLVQGHVDAVGELVTAAPELRVRMPADLLRYVVPKGSITVDGCSLTVVDVFDDGFSIAVIPHTAEVTTLGRKGPGDRVNLEVDVLAKHVERLMEAYTK